MGLLVLHCYLTPSQPPERALQEQPGEGVLALHVIICAPCPHNHCYSGSCEASALSLCHTGLCFRRKQVLDPRLAQAPAAPLPRTDLLGSNCFSSYELVPQAGLSLCTSLPTAMVPSRPSSHSLLGMLQLGAKVLLKVPGIGQMAPWLPE